MGFLLCFYEIVCCTELRYFFFDGIRLVLPINDALYSLRRGEDLISMHFLEEIKLYISQMIR